MLPLLTAQEPQSAPSIRIIQACRCQPTQGAFLIPSVPSCLVRNNPVRYRILVWRRAHCAVTLSLFVLRVATNATCCLRCCLGFRPPSPRHFALAAALLPNWNRAERKICIRLRSAPYSKAEFFFSFLLLLLRDVFSSSNGPGCSDLIFRPRASQKLSFVLAGLVVQ